MIMTSMFDREEFGDEEEEDCESVYDVEESIVVEIIRQRAVYQGVGSMLPALSDNPEQKLDDTWRKEFNENKLKTFPHNDLNLGNDQVKQSEHRNEITVG